MLLTKFLQKKKVSTLTAPKYDLATKWRGEEKHSQFALRTLMWNMHGHKKTEIVIVASWDWWFSCGFQIFCHFADKL